MNKIAEEVQTKLQVRCNELKTTLTNQTQELRNLLTSFVKHSETRHEEIRTYIVTAVREDAKAAKIFLKREWN